MKPIYAYLSIALLIGMLSLQQCQEETPPLTELEKLPPATQSGKNTFGCLVDGKAWVIEGTTDAQSDYQMGTLSVFAGVLNSAFYSNISFYIADPDLSEKTYQFREIINQPGNQYALYYDHRTSCEFATTAEYNGAVTITHLDRSRHIISGTFQFEIYSADCIKVTKVTDGRFDIEYVP
jgi:hypothetical protein